MSAVACYDWDAIEMLRAEWRARGDRPHPDMWLCCCRLPGMDDDDVDDDHQAAAVIDEED